MNDQRRKRVKEAIVYLEKAKDIADLVYEDESDAVDNMPENLQFSDRFNDMEDAMYAIGDAIERIDDATELLERVL